MAGSEKTRRPDRVGIPLEPREFETENQPLNFSSPEADFDQFVLPATSGSSLLHLFSVTNDHKTVNYPQILWITLCVCGFG